MAPVTTNFSIFPVQNLMPILANVLFGDDRQAFQIGHGFDVMGRHPYFIEQFPIKGNLPVGRFNLALQKIVAEVVERLPGQVQILFHLPDGMP
ncbi:MAG: hypothetical protein JJV98_12985 [Desulfosarcina sp.]|nr:hypothetical protein [Desulfobacterales bacterium]